MATFKCIEPTAENILRFQNSLNEIDCMMQGVEEKTSALVASITTLLTQPDNGNTRVHIKTLCDMIALHAADVSNITNAEAEKYGAHYIDEVDRGITHMIHAAANRGEVSHV